MVPNTRVVPEFIFKINYVNVFSATAPENENLSEQELRRRRVLEAVDRRWNLD